LFISKKNITFAGKFNANTKMKKFYSLLSIAMILLSCNQPVDNYPEPIVGSYAYGADCSWITEQA
jgi:hypothetical protein